MQEVKIVLFLKGITYYRKAGNLNHPDDEVQKQHLSCTYYTGKSSCYSALTVGLTAPHSRPLKAGFPYCPL